MSNDQRNPNVEYRMSCTVNRKKCGPGLRRSFLPRAPSSLPTPQLPWGTLEGLRRDFDGAFASAVCSGPEEKLVRTRFSPEAWSLQKTVAVRWRSRSLRWHCAARCTGALCRAGVSRRSRESDRRRKSPKKRKNYLADLASENAVLDIEGQKAFLARILVRSRTLRLRFEFSLSSWPLRAVSRRLGGRETRVL